MDIFFFFTAKQTFRVLMLQLIAIKRAALFTMSQPHLRVYNIIVTTRNVFAALDDSNLYV